MSDHVVLLVDRLIRPPSSSSSNQTGPPAELSASPSCSTPNSSILGKENVNDEDDEGEPLIQEAEICHQPYQPGYIAPPRPPHSDDTAIDISGGWIISGTPLDLHDPRLLAIAEAERHFLESEYDEYDASNASGAAFCRSIALIVPNPLFDLAGII